MDFDELDARILRLFTHEPRISFLEASRRLQVARGTVQARLARLEEHGVIVEYGPRLDPSRFGYPITALVSLIVEQMDRDKISELIGDIPEVLELHTVAGGSDFLAKIVARSTEDLQRLIDELLAAKAIRRVSSSIILSTRAENRAERLFRRTAVR